MDWASIRMGQEKIVQTGFRIQLGFTPLLAQEPVASLVAQLCGCGIRENPLVMPGA